MEASFVNFVRPGDPVVIGVNGVFGERMCDVAGRCGAEVVRVEAPWGEPIDPAALAARPCRPPPSSPWCTPRPRPGYAATSHRWARARATPCCWWTASPRWAASPSRSTVGAIDIAYSGTQKCLGCPPGLSPLTVSDRARARLLEKPASWYLDLNMIARYVGGEGARAYHHTAPISMVFALHAALGAVLDEGLEASWARHAAVGAQLQHGLAGPGSRAVREPTVTGCPS